MPRRMTKGSCGYDFVAPEDIEIKAGEWTTISTGVCFDGSEQPTFDGAVYSDWFMLIAPRSSYGIKYGFRLANTVGIIDKDYRDPIMAKVTADVSMTIKKGDRFMQGIILPYGKISNEVTPEDERIGGIGSTDTKKVE